MDNQSPNNNQYNNGPNGGNGPEGNNRNNPNNKNNRSGQMIMSFIMIALVVLFFVSLFSNRFAEMNTKETTYSEFLAQLEDKNIASVEFDNYQINYTLVKEENAYDVTYYTGYVEDEMLVEQLKHSKTSEGNPIEISATIPDNTSSWIINILSFVIPVIFLWILFGFLMRRMDGGAMGVGKSTAKVPSTASVRCR